MEHSTFTLETSAARGLDYFEGLVDAYGVPYFNVFWASPSLAAHDWPDAGDVTGRQLQGAVMARRMTGRTARTEPVWRDALLSNIDPTDGLFYRPARPWSARTADWGDAALVLYALVTDAVDSGDPDVARAARRLAEALLARARSDGLPPSFPGFSIKSFMTCARTLGSDAAAEAAGLIVTGVFADERIFTRANTFTTGGHMHGNLRTLVGAIDYAAAVGDAALLQRVEELYRWVRGIGTRFGFLPEAYARPGDVVSCETCALMDYAGLGVSLARRGGNGYWADMERLARNHYAESQLVDGAWLGNNAAPPDTEQFTWRDLDTRSLGAWAGWSSPTQFLAARETLNIHWGGPELHGKTRALQNCCGGSGVHGLYILWRNGARFENGILTVALHFDRLLPQAEIRCFQPWKGLTRVTMRAPGHLRIRVPDFAPANSMRMSRNGNSIRLEPRDGFLTVTDCLPGQVVEMSYPLPVVTEQVTIGNPGHHEYRFTATWKGDTVVRMVPAPDNPATGWSDFDKAEVPLFYGETGPARLYRRDHMIADGEPTLSGLHEEGGGPDFWSL